MQILTEKLKGKKIGILGKGYIGKRLFNLFRDTFNIETIWIDRDNLNTEINKHTFDYFFNCAGNTGDFRKSIDKTIESNLILNQFLLQNIRLNDAYVYLSSTRIYGFTQNEHLYFHEEYQSNESHTEIDFIYNGAKKLTECYLMNKETSFKKIVCRLSNVYGDYEYTDLDDSTYIKFILKMNLENKNILTNQNINSTKDYIYIEDALTGIIYSALYSIKNDFFNIASGTSYSLKDWFIFLNQQFEETKMIQIPATHSKIDISKSRNMINFEPIYNLSNLDKKKLFSWMK